MIKIMNHELAKTLTTALVQFIDRKKPEDTMCCSNIECGALEEAFKSDNLDDVEAFIQKKLSRLTEFEEKLVSFAIQCEGEWNTANEEAKKWSRELLDLAKKELARREEVITLNNLPPYDKGFQDGKAKAMTDLERTFECNPDKLPGWLKDELNKAFKKGQESSHEDYIKGYTNGYKDAEEKYNESVAYHFPSMPVTPSGYRCDGTYCINPQMDCINCPRRTDGGMFNTQSGTATLKAEG